jgi:putative inorganic carbon (hco3(-)) transporter
MKNNLLTIVLYLGIAIAGGFFAYKMVHVPKQAELVVIVSLLLLYPIFRYPMVGLYAAFLIGPFIPAVRRMYYLVHGRPGIDPLIMVTDILVVVVFIGLFFELRERLRDKSDRNGTFLTLVAIYLVYMVVRAFAFNILPVSESVAKLKFYAPNVLLFFIGYVLAQRLFHLRILWGATLAISIAASLYGIKQLFIGYSTAEKVWFSTISFTTMFINGVARPFSFFQAPAVFADYLILGIIAALMVASWGKVKSKLIAIAAIPLLFYGVLITSVRSSWIGALAIFLFWFVFVKMEKMGSRVLMIIAVAGGFFIYQLMDDMISTGIGVKGLSGLLSSNSTSQNYIDLLVTTRASAITNPLEEHSLLSRVALWTYLFDSSLDPERALLGRGLGSMNADSLYITYLAEFGYPGMLLIVFLIFGFIIRGLKSLDKLSDPRVVTLAKGIVVMDVVFALMNITGTHMHSFPGDMYFWFFNGVLMNIHLIDAHCVEERSAT